MRFTKRNQKKRHASICEALDTLLARVLCMQTSAFHRVLLRFRRESESTTSIRTTERLAQQWQNR